jgi:uncharacterized protein YbjQ (UPF0145 family)
VTRRCLANWGDSDELKITQGKKMNDTAQKRSEMIIVTSDEIPLMKIVALCGPVRGGTSRAKHLGRDIFAGLKNIVGGEVVGYTELLAEAREEALYRMKLDAKSLGANAVIAFRFTSATVGVGVAEVTAYGTAVIAEGLEAE